MKRVVAVAAVLLVAAVSAPAVAVPAASGRVAYSEFRDDTWRLMVMRPDGTGARRAYAGEWSLDPDWSPDGRWLAFSGYERHARYGNAQILVMRRDGTGVRRVTSLPGYKRSPSWSPNGRELVFSVLVQAPGIGTGGVPGAYAATCELRVVDVVTGKERTLHAFGTVAYDHAGLASLYGECPAFPSWSPLGDLIVFNQVTNAYTTAPTAAPEAILVIRPDGTGVRRLADGVAGFAPKWSPDGRRLVFTAPLETGSQRSAVHIVNADGTGREILTPDSYDGHFATFSPDGREVLFQGFGPGGRPAHLYRVPAIGGTPVQLTRGPRPHVIPDWTGDPPPPRRR